MKQLETERHETSYGTGKYEADFESGRHETLLSDSDSQLETCNT